MWWFVFTWCFLNVLFVFHFFHLCNDMHVDLFVFILIGLISFNVYINFFSNLGEFLPSFLWISFFFFFFAPFSLCPPANSPIMHALVHLIVSHLFLRLCYFFFLPFSFCFFRLHKLHWSLFKLCHSSASSNLLWGSLGNF